MGDDDFKEEVTVRQNPKLSYTESEVREMSKELTKEVKKLAILIAQEMQKNPASVTSDMLTALRNSAKIHESENSSA
ncbi:MAG: hypothetical protein PHQ46_11180, partial [Negativicutes bacterium]|nr:hypothetical protein [Negativicutes bacterium]